MEIMDRDYMSTLQPYTTPFQGSGYTQYYVGNQYLDKCNFILELKTPSQRKYETDCAYPTGYHLFPSYEEALSYFNVELHHYHRNVIMEVKYRKVVAIGKQFDKECVVAKEIEFVKEMFPVCA
jgi:hypothetical protein